MSAASSVPTNSRLPRIATPRLNGLISYGFLTFCGRVYRQICRPDARVERDDLARLRRVHHAVDDDRRRLEHRRARHRERPRGLQADRHWRR